MQRVRNAISSASTVFGDVVDSAHNILQTAACGGCSGGLVCGTSGQCVPCGSVAAPCCTASDEEECIQTGVGQQECVNGLCRTCGTANATEPCCEDEVCLDGRCESGFCVFCGQRCTTNPCTAESDCCGDDGLTCNGPGDLVCREGTCYEAGCFQDGLDYFGCVLDEKRCEPTVWPDVDGTPMLMVSTCAVGGSCGEFPNWGDKTIERFPVPPLTWVNPGQIWTNWCPPMQFNPNVHCVGGVLQRCVEDLNCPLPGVVAGGWSELVGVCPGACNAPGTGCE